MKLIIYISITIAFFSCNETQTNFAVQENEISQDSIVKMFFFNNKKKEVDSIYLAMQKTKYGRLGMLVFNIDSLFNKASEKTKLTYDHYSFYAKELANQGNYKKALELIADGEKLPHPKSRSSFDKALVWAYSLPLGQRELMYRYLDESVFYDSLNPYYLVMRSQFYKEDSLYDKSIQDINHALKLSPNDTDYINLRGTFKFYKQDFSGALSDLKILSVSSKKSPDIYEFRAFCLGRLEKFKEAYQDANIALNLDSNRSKALVIRAISKYKLFNDREGAVNDMRKASNLGDTEAIEYMRAYEEYLKTHKKS